jgi:hypothetical protein
MKRHYQKFMLCIALIASFFVISIAFAAIDTSGGWRLPFSGNKTISDGPGEDLHTGRSAEAID